MAQRDLPNRRGIERKAIVFLQAFVGLGEGMFAAKIRDGPFQALGTTPRTDAQPRSQHAQVTDLWRPPNPLLNFDPPKHAPPY